MAAPEMVRLHAKAIPVESFEGCFIQSGQHSLGDRPVVIAVSPHGKRGRIFDSPFRNDNPLRLRDACSELAGEVHPHAREALEKGVHAEERAAPKARLPRRLVGEGGRLRDIGDVIVVAKYAHDTLVGRVVPNAPRCFDDIPIRQWCASRGPVVARPYHDRRLALRLPLDYGQRCAKDAFQEKVQFLRREPSGVRRIRRQHDLRRAIDDDISRCDFCHKAHKENKRLQTNPKILCGLCDLCGQIHCHNPSNVSEPSGFKWMQKRVEHVYSLEWIAIWRLHGMMF